MKLGLGDEVEDAFDAASARTLDVRVEPLDEPPPAKRGAAYGALFRDRRDFDAVEPRCTVLRRVER